MAQYIGFDPHVEVNGQTVLTIIEGMAMVKSLAVQILKENGLSNIEKDHWYSQQNWLNVYKTIGQKLGPSTLYQIGTKIPENANFPPDIDTLHKALTSIDIAYHFNHRGGEIGHYTLSSFGKNEAIMICENPYPCDFDRGLISAMVHRFVGAGNSCIVTHSLQGECRKNGGESCTYTISYMVK